MSMSAGKVRRNLEVIEGGRVGRTAVVATGCRRRPALPSERGDGAAAQDRALAGYRRRELHRDRDGGTARSFRVVKNQRHAVSSLIVISAAGAGARPE